MDTLQPLAPAAAPTPITPEDLVYASDETPGIRRRRHGKGFSYAGADGTLLRDAEALARIRSLVIPPAWTDVWISPDASGHIQATGRDERGRKQYRYHPVWLANRSDVKFTGLTAFAAALPRLRARVEVDLARRGLPRERVLASIVWLLDHTPIRIGNEAYRRANASFGLTTLRSRHVEVEGARLRFAFVGKSGKAWSLKLTDRRIARIVAAIDDLPGRQLFKYLDEAGARRPVDATEVNAYIRAGSGANFTSKHFRTWFATLEAARLFAAADVPATKTALRRKTNEVIDAVAHRLHNTRSVCRSGYIHPAILSGWEEGTLTPEFAELRRRYRKPLAGLGLEESLLLRWLRARGT
ncbi:DNA topoisomerase IB [Methylobrevis albus]|uniref:DNA topoisomerase IB n=1 Tax=Methylobrevis albus TaxID=2793297 RepID=UPI001F484B8F|nr:DNA topoisomerase IB [Methylobrevis albus]